MRYLSAWPVTLALFLAPGGTQSMLEERPPLRAAIADAVPPDGVPPALRTASIDLAPDALSFDAIGPMRVTLPPPPSPALLPEMPIAASRGRSSFRDLVSREARQQGIPTELVDGVAQIESGYNALAVGTVGEVGLMQIRPETARMLGFGGTTDELFRPEVNVHYAAAYLAGAWRLAKGDLCRTLMKYRAGHGEERMSTLSVEYCRRVRTHFETIGSPLALAVIPKADFVSPGMQAGLLGATASRSGTATLAAMAMWKRNGQTSGRSGSERRGGNAAPVSAYVEANRTPLYKALLRNGS